MDYLHQTIDSVKLAGIINLPLALRDKQVEVIIIPAGNTSMELSKQKRNLGFINGPPLPDSFFDPLPEEELQLWGL